MDVRQLEKIRNRQLARFLSHLKTTGQLTPALESDVKRAYRYMFEDIQEVRTGHDKEIKNVSQSNDQARILG